MSPSRLKRETCPTQEWCHRALLISSQINSQLFLGNKGSRGGNQPPKGQMVSVQSPLTPAALVLSDRAARALGETATQCILHPCTSDKTVLPD
ncbi:hypothetical protein PBY51_021616 [Eleginops maclovinus]|uniref:Uncharacterized protein n=1 Tax=Eleginops maclovinus TaxID=56733 RepID=A0AAN7XBE6_ELEMC|nr:hypothetical protein PBY51_021616 [Eleginops maclovinus]